MYDIVIKNGLVVDGTGAPGRREDIAIKGDRIVKITSNIETEAKSIIDARGKIVIPGFIDPHVHEEVVCYLDGRYEHFLKQGVTTVVNGNCGHSVVNGPTDELIDYYWENGLFSDRQREEYKKSFPKWKDFEGYSQAAEGRSNLNFVTLLGHGSIRWSVMKGAHDRRPTPEEDREIERIIRSNMAMGAWGISFGLDYVPSRYADTDELVGISKIIREYDGVAAAHLRNYEGTEKAAREFLDVGRASGVGLQFSHLKPTCREAFETIKEAVDRKEVKALIDTIPRSTGHCVSKSRLIQFIMAISDEFFGKREEDVRAALKTREGREIIKKDSYIFGGDKSDKFIILSEKSELEYRSVEEIALERGVDPDECMLDLIGDDYNHTFWLGGPSRADFPEAAHSSEILENPYVCVGTDEIMGDPKDPYDWYELQRRGGFPIFMKMYLSEGIPLEEIVRRNTSMVADHFGIEKRGVLKEGSYADIAVFNLQEYSFPGPKEIDYRKPETTAEGVDTVVVNGVYVMKSGRVEESFSGRVLRKGV